MYHMPLNLGHFLQSITKLAVELLHDTMPVLSWQSDAAKSVISSLRNMHFVDILEGTQGAKPNR